MRDAAIACLALLALRAAAAAEEGPARPLPAPQAAVEVEEDVYSYDPADNGAGPLWCFGSTCLVRIGDDVFASGLETLKDAKPLNNCRWLLLERGRDGWELRRADPAGRTREPCPLACFQDGPLFLSANPTLVTDPATYGGPARPEVLEFAAADAKAPTATHLPAWQGEPAFTEHSYRSFAADGRRREMILFQNIGYAHTEWAFRDGQGRWSASGKLAWPWGAEYDKPQPIRVCYPTVALKDRAVHFCGVSDIVEPYAAWRAHKKEITGKDWDYDFRRLFYTWTPDITSGKFADWVEVASRDKTCGGILPRDLWVAPDGRVHLLWTERAIDPRLREKFFPGEKQSHALAYAVVDRGKVVLRRTLALAEEGVSGEIASYARFHVLPDARLFVFFYVGGHRPDGKPVSENRLMEVGSDGTVGPAAVVPLKHPFSEYFTATVRAGSAPSDLLDVLGHRAGAGNTISYARIRVK